MSNQDSRSSVEAPPRKEGTPLSRAMRPINHVVERLIPSALVFSILLTFIVVVLALILTGTQPADLVVYWGRFGWAAGIHHTNGPHPAARAYSGEHRARPT